MKQETDMQGSNLKFHPYAEIFPLIEGADFDALTADIKTFGLREKIWTYEGKILDGRNRFLACKKAGVDPEFREFRGTDAGALAFVISLNVQRRHLTESQRALAAAKIATLKQGARTDLAPIGAKSQSDAADELDVSRRSVQRAKKVVEKGSKALQQAVESGEVSVSKAAAVVDLPKSEQLKAAKARPEKESEPDIEDWEPDEDEEAALELAEKEYAASIDKVMEADDKLAAAHAEIKRQAAEIASLKLSRDGFQNRCDEVIRRYKQAQRAIEKLEKQLARLAA